LLILSLSIPAVVRNNLWWHPDSMATLLTILVIYFLNRDGLKFGRDFYITAVLCGYLAGTKGIGFYFFLAIAVYLLLGLVWEKATFRKLFVMGLVFLLCMGAGYLLANPILVYRGVRNDYFALMQRQSVELYSGYWVLYPKGFLVSLPQLTEYFGYILFSALALITCVIGIMKDKNRLLNIIILTWVIPMAVFVFWISNFKFQYWIPVALPLFATMMDFLPDRITWPRSLHDISFNKLKNSIPQIVLSLAIMFQVVGFTNSSFDRYMGYLNREDDKPALKFHDLALNALKPMLDNDVFAYHEVRMYFPPPDRWKTETAFEPLNYDYIRSKDFDIVLIMQQRIYDYLNPDVEGIHPEEFARSQVFYRDANDGTVEGYQLIFRNDFGLVLVRDELYQQYFEKK